MVAGTMVGLKPEPSNAIVDAESEFFPGGTEAGFDARDTDRGADGGVAVEARGIVEALGDCERKIHWHFNLLAVSQPRG